MAQGKTKRAIVTGSVVLGILLLIIGGIALAQSLIGGKETDPYKQQNIENTSTDESNSKTDRADEDTSKAEEKPVSEEKTIDPATVSTIDITQMGITVSYVKGVGGFEYIVKRSPRGGQYVEFRSEQLKGTKCTDDQGAFASIIEQPDATESAALTKKVTVEGVEYGLSLAAPACAPDAALLTQYQTSFKDAFSLLKKSS